MFFQMTWDIWFYNETGSYQLRTLKEVEINASVDNLVDTATITLPEAVLNAVLNIKEQITRGTKVVVNLGYDYNNVTEFVGFVKEIITDNNAIVIECEDALFLFRKQVKDVELKPTSLKEIAEHIVAQVDASFKVVCPEYDLGYEKFLIHQATAYDVLKKLQEETKANIYFNTDKKELHIHPPYTEKGGEVLYSAQKNIRAASLEYKKVIDKKVEITVQRTGVDGKVQELKKGTTGGDAITIKVGAITSEAAEKIVDAELLKRSSDMYEGSVETWLVPFVAPSYTAKYADEDYSEKKGSYYVVSVKTNFSEAGGKRTVQLGVKLGNG